MKTFKVYRTGDISATHDDGTANAPDEVQFEGVVFTDGSVAIRWRTKFKSTSVFATLADLMNVHGHPEYKTVIEFSDGRRFEGNENGTWKKTVVKK